MTTCSNTMATKTRRWIVFPPLALFMLTTSMGCYGDDYYQAGILELEGARAVFSVAPIKNVYKVGDTVWLSIRAEKELWNNWPLFEKADFRLFGNILDTPFDDESIVQLSHLSNHTSRPVFADGKWLYKETEAYKLGEAKTYVLDLTKYRSLDETPYKVNWKLQVSYSDTKQRTDYETMVPIYPVEGPGSVTLKVEE